ncbi:hypothetical protein ALUC_11326A [Aspergillus luchuensis]|nr:hypothetical protein ALUC_11326A [Aspergillus luchuensis]
MTDSPTTTTTTSPPPPPPPRLRIGVLLFPGFQALDVFGPLDVLNVLSWSTNTNTPDTLPPPTPPISLTLLSTTLTPISTLPLPPQRPLPIHPPNSNPHLLSAARRPPHPRRLGHSRPAPRTHRVHTLRLPVPQVPVDCVYGGS